MKTTDNLLKKALLAVCLLAACWMPARADVLMGDVDGDGTVGLGDVTALIDFLLTQDGTQALPVAADVDGDGEVTIADLSELIDVMLLTPSQPAEEHEWVDLGLPSGTLWATCNVGADKPEDYGDYFAWGETAPKDSYSWSNYKWCNGSNTTLTKYCCDSGYGYNGFTDGKTELDPEDDAAYVNWGPSWCMPTIEQQRELCECCTWLWTAHNGVNGVLVTGPNGNTLFLPAGGSRWDELLNGEYGSGYYWSRTLYSYGPGRAYGLYFTAPGYAYGPYFRSGNWGDGHYYRNAGNTVRAVRVS